MTTQRAAHLVGVLQGRQWYSMLFVSVEISVWRWACGGRRLRSVERRWSHALRPPTGGAAWATADGAGDQGGPGGGRGRRGAPLCGQAPGRAAQHRRLGRRADGRPGLPGAHPRARQARGGRLGGRPGVPPAARRHACAQPPQRPLDRAGTQASPSDAPGARIPVAPSARGQG